MVGDLDGQIHRHPQSNACDVEAGNQGVAFGVAPNELPEKLEVGECQKLPHVGLYDGKRGVERKEEKFSAMAVRAEDSGSALQPTSPS